MLRWLKKLEVMAMAVAFAEAGEWETAERMLEEKSSKPKKQKPISKKKQNRRPRLHA